MHGNILIYKSETLMGRMTEYKYRRGVDTFPETPSNKREFATCSRLDVISVRFLFKSFFSMDLSMTLTVNMGTTG